MSNGLPANDPYVTPEEPSTAQAIAAIGEELAVFDDWMDRFEFIIDLGRKLPEYPQALADDAHRVRGCQARVWLAATKRDGLLYFAGMADAAIVSGLVALVLRVYSGRSRDEILATSPMFLRDLGLVAALSTNRGNGVAAMVERIQTIAEAT